MKILYLITTSEFGGATKNVYYLAKRFAKEHEVHIIAGDNKWLAEEAARSKYHFHCIPAIVKPIAPFKDLLALVNIIRFMRMLRPDLVHCHSSKTGLLGRVAAKLLGIPVIFTAHGWSTLFSYGKIKTFVYKTIEKVAAYFTDAMICVSTRDLLFSRTLFPGKRIELIFNGLPDSAYIKKTPNLTEPLKIIMVARFAHPKTPDIVLQAQKQLKEKGVELSVTFAGDGPELDQYRKQAANLKLGSKETVFLGDCDTVEQQLPMYDVFVLSSIWEGLPVSIVEALRAGLPVVASDVGGINDQIINGENGWLVAGGDVDAMDSKICWIDGHRDWLLTAGVRSRELFNERFSEAAMIKQTMCLYKELLATDDDKCAGAL